MNDQDLASLLRAARRVSEGEPFSGDLLAEEGVPVVLRLVVAAVALSAAERPVNKKALTTVAPAARSATYRDHPDLLDGLVRWLPDLIAAQLRSAGAPASATELARQLALANESIARERQARAQATEDLTQVAAYARELHLVLQPEHEALLRDQESKVRPLRVVPNPIGEEDGP